MVPTFSRVVFRAVAILLFVVGVAIPVWIISEGGIRLLEWPSLATMLVMWFAGGVILWRGKAWSILLDETQRARRAYYSLAHGTELVYWVGPDNLIIDVNERCLSVLGYSRENLVGRSPALFDKGWIFERQAELWADLAAGRVLEQETSYKTRLGEWIPVKQEVNFFRDGRQRYLCCFGRDITKEVSFSQQLEHAQALFGSFLEGLSTGVFIRDEDGRFVYFNEMFRRWNPKIQVGTTLNEIYPADRAAQYLSEDRSVTAEGPKTFFTGDDSETVMGPYFEILKFPIFLADSKPMVAGLIIDVTRRHLSERRLAESSAYLEALVEQSPVGVIVLESTVQNIRTVNRAAHELLGTSEIPSQGLPFELLDPDGNLSDPLLHPIAQAFVRHVRSDARMILRRSDGQERSVLVNASPVMDNRGTFLAVIVTLQDITELQKAELELEKINHRLEGMVVDRTRELIGANEALTRSLVDLRRTQDQLIEREKLASLGGLVAGVAHEINTPVGVAVTAGSFLREQAELLFGHFSDGSLKRSELESFLRLARDSTEILLTNLQRAANLIKSFKMISVDQSTDQRRIFRLKDYLQEVLISLRPTDKRLHIDAVIEGDPELSITSYPGTLAQILTNLFMNSCVHAFEGCTVGQIKISFTLNGERLILTYTDNGKGMEDWVVRKIFEPFFTTRRDLGGSGLGMNIVFNLVYRKLGGSIEAWSELGQGTRFVIDVPIAPPANDADLPAMITG